MALEPVGVGAQVELAGLGEAALLAVVRGQPRPEHVAIIMDGNGRWATRRGLPRVAGHREGVKAARTIVRAADALGLRYLTLYAFSSENWSRPEGEVSTLLSLLERAIRSELPELMRRNVRLRVLGRPHGVPVQVRRGGTGGGLKRITLLGATGSLGLRTLALVSSFSEEFAVAGLAARGSNVERIADLCRKYSPRAVALLDAGALDQLARLLPAPRPELLSGPDGLVALARDVDADVVVSALVGGAGLLPTMAAILAGRTVALANKETLVMAGSLMTAAARARGVRLLPVDSEHSAVFQCLAGHNRADVHRIVLTASGGPFRETPRADLAAMTVEDALKHPTWKMGAKITIDP